MLSRGSVLHVSAQLAAAEGLVVGLDFGGATVSFEHQAGDRAELAGGRLGYTSSFWVDLLSTCLTGWFSMRT